VEAASGGRSDENELLKRPEESASPVLQLKSRSLSREGGIGMTSSGLLSGPPPRQKGLSRENLGGENVTD
jgi:hypothetical protein